MPMSGSSSLIRTALPLALSMPNGWGSISKVLYFDNSFRFLFNCFWSADPFCPFGLSLYEEIYGIDCSSVKELNIFTHFTPL
jgi:hypothetical protein